MNMDRMQGNWKQFNGQIKELWGQLVHDPQCVLQGEREELTGKIQERRGICADEAIKQPKGCHSDLPAGAERPGASAGPRAGASFPF